MEKRLAEFTAEEFVSLLSSSAPAPGGGGAAAMCGALASALCAMVGNISLSKGKAAAAELTEKTARITARLLELIELDAHGFEPLAAVYSLPKDTPDYDDLKLNACLKALEAPRQMMENVCALIDLLGEMRQISSKLLLSDIGCAAVLAAAALKSAAMNVYVNTRLIKQHPQAADINRRAEAMLAEYIPTAESLADGINAFLKE